MSIRFPWEAVFARSKGRRSDSKFEQGAQSYPPRSLTKREVTMGKGTGPYTRAMQTAKLHQIIPISHTPFRPASLLEHLLSCEARSERTTKGEQLESHVVAFESVQAS
jgi:hypothetical protein